MANKFFNFFSRIFPSVKAEDEDIVDPHETLRNKCKENKKAQDMYAKYVECNDRVNSRKETAETCMEELFDYVAFVDHCASHDLFAKLK